MREVFPVREKGILKCYQKVRENSGNFVSHGKLDQKIKKKIYGESLKSVISRYIFIEDEFHMKNMFIISEYWGQT